MSNFAFGFNNPQFSDYHLELISGQEEQGEVEGKAEELDLEPFVKSLSDVLIVKLSRLLRREVILRKKKKSQQSVSSTPPRLPGLEMKANQAPLMSTRATAVEGEEVVATPRKKKNTEVSTPLHLSSSSSAATIPSSMAASPSSSLLSPPRTTTSHMTTLSNALSSLSFAPPGLPLSALATSLSHSTSSSRFLPSSSSSASLPSSSSFSSSSSSSSSSSTYPSYQAISPSSAPFFSSSSSPPLCCPPWPRFVMQKAVSRKQNNFVATLDEEERGGEVVEAGGARRLVYPVNSIVLSASSPFFRILIEQCSTESKTFQVHVDEENWPLFTRVLQCMYDMELGPIDVCEAVSLLLLSERFQVDKVRRAVVTELSKKALTLSDARTLMQLPDAFFSSEELTPFRGQCGDIFAGYVLDLDAFLEGKQIQLMTASELHALLRSEVLQISSEDSTWHAVALWSAAHDPDPQTVGRLCQVLRFPLMSPGYIHDVVCRSELTKLFPEVVMPYVTFGLGFHRFSLSRQKTERKNAPEHWFKPRGATNVRTVHLRFVNARKLAEQGTCKTHAIVQGYDLAFYLHRMGNEFSLTIGTEAGREEHQGFKRLIALKVAWGAVSKKCELGAAWGVKLIALNRNIDSVNFESDESLNVELVITAQPLV